jgi:hypothetical protein
MKDLIRYYYLAIAKYSARYIKVPLCLGNKIHLVKMYFNALTCKRIN